MQTNRHAGLTLMHVAIALAALAILVALLLPVLARAREQANRSNCRNNQKQLVLANVLYRDSAGGTFEFPPLDGSALLAAFYTSGVLSEPNTYLCPSSGDENASLVWSTAGKTGALTSYAALRWSDPAVRAAMRSPTGASARVMISDDDEGNVAFNHGDCCIMAFSDGHVEEVPFDDPRLANPARVGQGFLGMLAN